MQRKMVGQEMKGKRGEEERKSKMEKNIGEWREE